MPARLSPLVARLMLLAVAALFSTGGAAIKSTSLTAWQVASFRSGIAAAVVWLLVPAARRGWERRTWLVGLAYGGTMVSFVVANKLTTAANAIFLQAAAPLYILALGPWLLREPVRRRDLLFALPVALGLLCFFVSTPAPAATASNPRLGNLVGVASGIGWALTVLGLRWVGTSSGGGDDDAGSTYPAVVAGNLVAFLACLPLALPVHGGTAADWIAVAYLGTFQIGLAYVMMASAIRHVPAFEASALLLLEPALNPVWAWLVNGERPGAWALAGGAIIILATAWKTLDEHRRTGVVMPPASD